MFGDGLEDHVDDLLSKWLVPATQRKDERTRLLEIQTIARLLVDEWKPL